MRTIEEYRLILTAYEAQPVKNMSGLARELKIPRRTIIDTIRKFGDLNGLDQFIINNKGKLYSFEGHFRVSNDEEFAQIVRNSFSIAQVAKGCGLVAAGGNYLTIKIRIKKLGLDTSHFTGKGHLKGKKNPSTVKMTLEEICVENSSWRASSRLRKRLIAENVFEHKCKECGLLPEWNGKPLTLQLDHINGDRTDNRLENLRFLCPNCHTQTITFGRRKSCLIGVEGVKVDPETVKIAPRITTLCSYCSKEVSSANVKVCEDCYAKHRSEIQTPYERFGIRSDVSLTTLEEALDDLEHRIEQHQTVNEIARALNITPTAVRHRIKKLKARTS